MAVTITTVDLVSILDLTPRHHNIMLAGMHGIGKSRIITDYFTKKGHSVVTLFLGQMSDPGDIIGLPALNELTGKTEFRLPWWFPEDDAPLVLFLDELNRARPEILQCVMDLTLNKAIVGRKLPEKTRIIAAVNEGEEYQLTDLDPALLSRFNLYTFTPTVDEWLLWAQGASIDKRIIGFIGENPLFLDSEIKDGLTKTADRRAWERVSDIISPLKSLEPVVGKVIAGIVGNAAAVQFMQYCRTSGGIDPIMVLTDFAKSQKALEKAKAHELSVLNESCFRIVEAEKDPLKRAGMTVNFEKYLQWLYAKGLSEVIAHFTTLFNSDLYPYAKIALITQAPHVMGQIVEYVKGIRL